jgi:hypothetical protein
MLLTMTFFFCFFKKLFGFVQNQRKKNTDPRVPTYKHGLLNNVGFFLLNFFFQKIRYTERPYKCQVQNHCDWPIKSSQYFLHWAFWRRRGGWGEAAYFLDFVVCSMFPSCSASSQKYSQPVPNSTTLLYHNLCQKP